MFTGVYMDKLSIYLFESKSIQAYLSRTGRLRHMIIASDRLDSLVGPDEDGLLQRSLRAAGLDPDRNTNIIASRAAGYEVQEDHGKIVFFRYLGGSFSCYALGEDGYKNLVRFRFAVTLAVQSELPGMQFSDALVSNDQYDTSGKEGFFTLLNDAYKELASAGNRPVTLLPLATACTASAETTGEAAVRSGAADARELLKVDRGIADAVMVKMATDYQKVNLSLYNRYLSEKDKAKDCDARFKESVNFNKSDDVESDGDIALIHMDGNSVGTTLIRLRSILSGKHGKTKTEPVSRSEYTKVMLQISDMLQKSTQKAVQTAIDKLLDKNENLIFRPLVLGGDDVTLLIEPRYAADFCVEFAKAFKQQTTDAFRTDDNPENNDLLHRLLGGQIRFLTSSGGILFQKKKHPYAGSVRLVEELAKMAKNRPFPKQNAGSYSGDITVNPSAVAFVRLTEASGESLAEILDRLRRFRIPANNCDFYTGSRNGFITCTGSGEDAGEVTLEMIAACVREQNGGPVISRFRRMLSEIACGRLKDAERLFEQACDQNSNYKNNPAVKLILRNVIRTEEKDCDGRWYSINTENNDANKRYYESLLNDILVLDHYIRENPREEITGSANEIQEAQ